MNLYQLKEYVIDGLRAAGQDKNYEALLGDDDVLLQSHTEEFADLTFEIDDDIVNFYINDGHSTSFSCSSAHAYERTVMGLVYMNAGS